MKPLLTPITLLEPHSDRHHPAATTTTTSSSSSDKHSDHPPAETKTPTFSELMIKRLNPAIHLMLTSVLLNMAVQVYEATTGVVVITDEWKPAVAAAQMVIALLSLVWVFVAYRGARREWRGSSSSSSNSNNNKES